MAPIAASSPPVEIVVPGIADPGVKAGSSLVNATASSFDFVKVGNGGGKMRKVHRQIISRS